MKAIEFLTKLSDKNDCRIANAKHHLNVLINSKNVNFCYAKKISTESSNINKAIHTFYKSIGGKMNPEMILNFDFEEDKVKGFTGEMGIIQESLDNRTPDTYARENYIVNTFPVFCYIKINNTLFYYIPNSKQIFFNYFKK